MIKPTVGRVVWYRPTSQDINEGMSAYLGSDQPFAAIVVFVHGDRMVNLSVLDHRGTVHEKRSVPLLQDDVKVLDTDGCAQWMPFQKGQAAKTDEIAKEAFASAASAVRASHGITDNAIEQEIQAKGLTAPRITPADIEANIVGEHYFTAEHGVIGAAGVAKGGRCEHEGMAIVEYHPAKTAHLSFLTLCVMILRNGTKIVGINYGAIDPNQHSAEQGREEARAHAIEQIWPLMGYELRSRLHERAQVEAGPQVGYGNAEKPEQADCPHAAPFRYCPNCVADPCPIGLGKCGDGVSGD